MRDMRKIYNVYCDESCHLENDHMPVMAIASVWCSMSKTRELSRELRQIKLKHGLSKHFEVKWTKVSPAKLDFYLEFIDYFFNHEDLHFRGIIIPEKKELDHRLHNQTHDEWYYKMFFVLLKEIIDPDCSYRIYLDIKDTRSENKRAKIEEILRSLHYDSDGRIIDRIQQIRSHESQIMQLTDLLMGALRYHNERLNNSKAKLSIINRIQERSGKTLYQTTWPKESKFNILIWKPGGKHL